MSDLIDRQQAIDALNEYFVRIGKLKRRGLNKGEKAISLDTVGAINSLPPAQPAQHLNKWCTDCKEYDKEKHSCQRWNRVIRQALADAQPQRTGKWIKGHCSECGDHAPYWSMSSAYYGSKFCPNCGAKMEGDAE